MVDTDHKLHIISALACSSRIPAESSIVILHFSQPSKKAAHLFALHFRLNCFCWHAAEKPWIPLPASAPPSPLTFHPNCSVRKLAWVGGGGSDGNGLRQSKQVCGIGGAEISKLGHPPKPLRSEQTCKTNRSSIPFGADFQASPHLQQTSSRRESRLRRERAEGFYPGTVHGGEVHWDGAQLHGKVRTYHLLQYLPQA